MQPAHCPTTRKYLSKVRPSELHFGRVYTLFGSCSAACLRVPNYMLAAPRKRSLACAGQRLSWIWQGSPAAFSIASLLHPHTCLQMRGRPETFVFLLKYTSKQDWHLPLRCFKFAGRAWHLIILLLRARVQTQIQIQIESQVRIPLLLRFGVSLSLV